MGFGRGARIGEYLDIIVWTKTEGVQADRVPDGVYIQTNRVLF